MQLNRSGTLVAASGISYACQYGVVCLPLGTSIPQNIGNVACAIGFFLFAFGTILVLGGQMLSPQVDEDGIPDINGAAEWTPFWMFVLMTLLVVTLYKIPAAFNVIDLFFLFGVIIRLIQWNGFEPNGLAEFEPT